MIRVEALVWGSWLALAMAASGCSVILGNDKDYSEIDGGTGVGGEGSGSSMSGIGGNAASCQDGVQDGAETDLDCGGGACPLCAVAQKCIVDADCFSNACDITTKTCAVTQCHDGIKNGPEADVDCGGGCLPCADGKLCLAASDCAGGGCCGGICADLATDAKNCGYCGKDCPGSTCSAKFCVPVMLASNESAPWGIAVDATNVYWTNNTAGGGLARKCAISGCGLKPTDLGPSSNGHGIATDGTNVYWASGGTAANGYMDGSIMKCPGAGCGGVPMGLATQHDPRGIAVDKANVYWTATGTVMKCAINGCAGSPTMLASGQSAPFGVAVGATSVYWANRNDGTVKRCLIGGCMTPTLVVTSKDPVAIAVGGQYAYFVNEYGGIMNPSGGSVVRIGLLGGAPTTLASSSLQASPLETIAIDGNRVYWTTGEGRVLKCTLNGCGGAPTTIAVGQGYPHGIAVDATSVYWTTGTTVMKTGK